MTEIATARPVAYGRIHQLASLQFLRDETFQFLGEMALDAPHEGDDNQDDSYCYKTQPEGLFQHPLRQRLVRNVQPAVFTADTFQTGSRLIQGQFMP